MDSRSLLRGRAAPDAVATSPLELLLHVTLALVPILAVALVTLNAIQTENIQRIQGSMDDIGANTLNELVIEIERQKLIDRYEAVLAERELRLQLAAFPLPDTATTETGNMELPAENLFPVDDDGFPNDPRFERLCAEAQLAFANPTDEAVEKLAAQIYQEAIRRNVDRKVMYDSQFHPMPAEVLAAHPQTPTMSPANRAYAMKRIGERIRRSVSHVRHVQLAAVASALATATQKRVLAFGGDDEGETDFDKVFAEVEENIHREFAQRGLTLIANLFEEENASEGKAKEGTSPQKKSKSTARKTTKE